MLSCAAPTCSPSESPHWAWLLHWVSQKCTVDAAGTGAVRMKYLVRKLLSLDPNLPRNLPCLAAACKPSSPDCRNGDWPDLVPLAWDASPGHYSDHFIVHSKLLVTLPVAQQPTYVTMLCPSAPPCLLSATCCHGWTPAPTQASVAPGVKADADWLRLLLAELQQLQQGQGAGAVALASRASSEGMMRTSSSFTLNSSFNGRPLAAVPGSVNSSFTSLKGCDSLAARMDSWKPLAGGQQEGERGTVRRQCVRLQQRVQQPYTLARSLAQH